MIKTPSQIFTEIFVSQGFTIVVVENFIVINLIFAEIFVPKYLIIRAGSWDPQKRVPGYNPARLPGSSHLNPAGINPPMTF